MASELLTDLIEVTKDNLDEMVQRYAEARGSADNEETNDEAMFVFASVYRGVFILNTAPKLGPIWIGLQNATAQWTLKSKPFSSVRHALEHVLNLRVYYSTDAIARLKWAITTIERNRSERKFLLY